MGSAGKRWTWKADAPGRAALAEKHSGRQFGRPFALKHGLGGTPIYDTWKRMMSRCYNPSSPDYVWYGARGIKVCERWHDPRNFLADMGEKRKGMSIERADVNGDYCKENCTWLPHRFQAKNRRPWKHTPEGLERIRAARRKE